MTNDNNYLYVQVRAAPSVSWVQVLILIIAVFIGVVAFLATIVICCLYSK